MARKKTKLTFAKRVREQEKKRKRAEKIERRKNRADSDEESGENIVSAEELFNLAIGLDPEEEEES